MMFGASLMSRMMISFIPSVGDLPEIEECLYLTTTSVIHLFQIQILFPLSIIKISIYDN